MTKLLDWLPFVIGAGLCWGFYVPFIQQGQANLPQAGSAKPGAYTAFLCVGIAYFLIAILVPVYMIWSGGEQPDTSKAEFSTGIVFALLAGTAGALGALCVIFAIKAGGDKRFVAPVIFATAPVINTVVSLFWHPSKETGVFNFGLPKDPPNWIFYLGICLAGLGAGLVLYAKEDMEKKGHKAPAKPVVTQEAPQS
jgi:protein-S-isoprenylcysteine O-methyltransferase Ste14